MEKVHSRHKNFSLKVTYYFHSFSVDKNQSHGPAQTQRRSEKCSHWLHSLLKGKLHNGMKGQNFGEELATSATGTDGQFKNE